MRLFKSLIIFLLCLFAVKAFPQFTDLQKTFVPIDNVQYNGGAEQGLYGWSETGSGTLTATTTAANKRTGKGAIAFTSSANSDYVSAPAVTIKKGTNDCEYAFYFKTSGSTAAWKAQVYQGANLINELSIGSSSSDFAKARITFVCTDVATAYSLRITNGSTETIYIDDVYSGENRNIGNTSQASLWASRKWQTTSGCEWGPYTSTAFGDFSADADCDNNTIAYMGEAIAESSNPGQLPQIYIRSLPVGEYLFVVRGGFYAGTTTAATALCLNRLYDGATELGSSIVNYYLDGTSTTDKAIESSNITGHLSVTSARSNVTISIQPKAGTNNTCYLENQSANHTPLSFDVYRFPSSSEQVVQADSSNKFGSTLWTNSGLFSTTSTSTVKATNGSGDANRINKGAAQNAGSNEIGLKISSQSIGGVLASFNSFMYASYSASTTCCLFGITDGTTENYTAMSCADSSKGTDYISSIHAYFENSSITDKNYNVIIKRTQGGGDCLVVNNFDSSQQQILTVTPVLPQIAMPQIVNLPIVKSARIGAGNAETACNAAPCGYYNLSGGSWISTNSRSSAGVYSFTVNPNVPNKLPSVFNCQCTARYDTQDTGCNVSNVSSTTIDVTFFKNGSLADGAFTLTCTGNIE